MKNILIVIDAQNDFISGALGNPACEPIVENIVKIIEKAKENDETIIATFDTHDKDYLDTLEGKLLPVPHCIEDTVGWQLDTRIYDAIGSRSSMIKIKKNTFGYDSWQHFRIYGDDVITIVGFDIDICVVSNALILRAMYPNNKIQVIADACWGTTKEKHKAALAVMESCQIEVI